MKFLASRELGRLAKWLRILGFDAAYFREDIKSSFIIKALREDRIVLTRNKILLQDRALHRLFIESEILGDQLRQIFKVLKLKDSDCRLFTRCIVCNQELTAVPKDKIKSKVPEYVFQTQQEFASCPQCERVYWQGTHWGNAQEILEKVSK